MRFHEYSKTPHSRGGTMVPVSALPDIFALPDAGYCSVYQFNAMDAHLIRAQKHSRDLGRFSVYTDRLWIDIDAANDSPQAIEDAKQYTRQLAADFKQQGLDFTVWFSGKKGYHICIKIHPIEGHGVPHSQLVYVRDTMKLTCDYSLYQHGRLLSNPGRLHPKTGIKKHRIMENSGTLLSIPLISPPERLALDTATLSSSDKARIALSRVQNLILDAPLPGMRHQNLWSAAMQLIDANMSDELAFGLLYYANEFFPEPKPKEEIWRAVQQARHQSR